MVSTAHFSKWIIELLDEVFGVANRPHGFVLDNGQSGLLGTVDGLSATVASSSPTAGPTTIASHCGHLLYLVQQFIAFERGETPAPDWPSSWQIRAVDEVAWQQLRDDLRQSYQILRGYLQERQEWPEPAVAATLMLLAHCSYHVGEIRQRLLWVG